MTLTLENQSGRLRVYLLPHEPYCAALGRCACTFTSDRHSRRLASSLTLATGVTVETEEAVLSVPEIASALRAGDLRLSRKPKMEEDPFSLSGTSPDAPKGRTSKKTRGEL